MSDHMINLYTTLILKISVTSNLRPTGAACVKLVPSSHVISLDVAIGYIGVQLY